MAGIRGLTHSHPTLGWFLVIAVVAIMGMPPFGLFMSEYMLVHAAVAIHPALGLLIVAGLMLAFSALVLKLIGLAFGEPAGRHEPVRVSVAPIAVHLLIALAAGVYVPDPFAAALARAARLLG